MADADEATSVSRWDADMARALALARGAGAAGDVPAGAVVLDGNGVLLGEGGNRREQDGDATAHAEVLAIRAACARRGAWRLDDCTLVVTLEPCTMCAGALVNARIRRLVFGAFDPKAGAIASLWDVVRDPRLNHRVEVVGGIMADDCQRVLTDFFATRR
ncbi:CMP/dCMP deaminase, zinc-binding [Propionibacterium freudenreichii]|nr:CMP/dCMP deaminase, zinc-binding [Propionibacterium freudenreichii]